MHDGEPVEVYLAANSHHAHFVSNMLADAGIEIPCGMRTVLSYFLVGLSSGWLLGAVGDGDFTSPVGRIGSSLGGAIGLIIGFIHLFIAASCRAQREDTPPNIESDRLLIRATVILALAASPILILWIVTSLSGTAAQRQLASIVAHLVRGFGWVIGALSIWLVVRSFNQRQDLRRIKWPPDAL
jgi:hypothetical protein